MRDEGIDAVRYSIIDALDGLTDFEGFPVSNLNYLQVIRKLRKQLTWRPVSEKPKEGQIVLASIPTGWVVAQYLHGAFYMDDGFTFGDMIGGVTHWLPIPPMEETR